MPNLEAAGITSRTPPVFDYKVVGTAAGTTIVCTKPAYLHGVVISTRVASGTIIAYDSIGTSGTVIATIVLGTQAFSDPPAPYLYDVRTKNGLTIENSANLGATVLFGA